MLFKPKLVLLVERFSCPIINFKVFRTRLGSISIVSSETVESTCVPIISENREFIFWVKSTNSSIDRTSSLFSLRAVAIFQVLLF